jgi:CRP-like cAMP-binding protein
VVEEGEEVVRQGSVGDCLFVVEEGELVVVRCTPGDEEEILAHAKPGSLLGELAVLDGGARAASLRALRRSVLRVIGLGAFEALALHGADAGHRILRAVAASVHERLNTTRSAAAPVLSSPGAPLAAGAAIDWTPAGSEVARVLSVLPAFAGLNAAEREAMMPRIGVASVGRGADVVLPEGEQPGIVLVLRGALSPWLDDARGPEATMPVIGPGGFVEYAAALGFASEPRRWRARSPTLLLRLDPALFDPGAACSKRLLYALSRGLATTLRRTTGLSMHFRMAWVRT